MTNHRDVGRVAADEDESVLGAERSGKLPFEFAMDSPLARGEAARRDRGSIARNGGHRCLVHPSITREVEIIVARVIEAATPFDDDLGTGDAVAKREIGVLETDTEERGLAALHHEIGWIPVEAAEIDYDGVAHQSG